MGTWFISGAEGVVLTRSQHPIYGLSKIHQTTRISDAKSVHITHHSVKSEVHMIYKFVPKQQALAQLKLSSTTLKNYRRAGFWIEDIHWVRINSRCVRYNLELIQDWLRNRQDPIAHQQAIAIDQASVLSNQRKPRQSANTSGIG
jgi:tRNA(His) 5'-end guanylyltransferase